MDANNQAFEDWLARQPNDHPRIKVCEIGGSLDDARYLSPTVSLAFAAWNAALRAQPAGGGGEDAEPPSDEVWPPDGAVWLAPVATDAPASPKLMQYAWGRSSLSSGQMAEAYQCIVSAAQECGQVYRLPVATPPVSGGQGEAVAWDDEGEAPSAWGPK